MIGARLLAEREGDIVNRATINHDLLRWARERRDASFAQIGRSLHVGVDVVRAWETGESYPSFAKAQALARFLKIPFGYLFLTKPPSDDIPLPDFRTIGDRRHGAPSPDFLDLCNQVLLKKEWYREYCEQISSPPVRFPDRGMNAGIDSLSEAIGDALSINAALRRECRDWSSYLTRLSQNAQSIGILVMRSGVVGNDTTRPLDVAEFRGFAIADAYAPVVFINSRDAIAAQIFTLLHEIAHIWIGQSGVSNPDPTEFSTNRFEKFCNAVSAQVLVPHEEFETVWIETPHGDSFLSSIARHFWVSTLVVLRRAFELNKFGREEFFRLVKIEKEKQQVRRRTSGGSFSTNLLARNSKRFTDGVLRAVRENQLLYRDAANLLGMGPPALSRLVEKYAF